MYCTAFNKKSNKKNYEYLTMNDHKVTNVPRERSLNVRRTFADREHLQTFMNVRRTFANALMNDGV